MTALDSDLRVRPRLADIACDIGVAWREYFDISPGGERDVPTTGTSSSAWGGMLPGTLWGPIDPPTEVDPSPADALRRLDALGLDRAVVNPGIAHRLTGLSNPRWAAEIASATNRWVERVWLEADERFLGSVVVGARSPQLAAEEIRRAGAHPRMVQVVLAFPHVYLGDRSMHVLYEAAQEQGLAVHLQAGGAYTGSNRGLTSAGSPFYVYEAEAGWNQAAQPHLTSLIAQGTFERFPGLRVVAGGFGAAWLPSLIWQLDTSYREGTVEVPRTLTRLPSQLLADHVFLTTERLEGPPDEVAALLTHVNGSTHLVFASGRRGLDSPLPELADSVPEPWRRMIVHDNPGRLHPSAVRNVTAA